MSDEPLDAGEHLARYREMLRTGTLDRAGAI